MIYMFIILGILIIIFLYHIYLHILPDVILYRVVYFMPTRKPIGITIKFKHKTRFYYYDDLLQRAPDLKILSFERFLRTLKNKIITDEIEFEKFDSYFSDNFYISPVIPIIAFRDYMVANDLLKAYKDSILII